MLLTAERGIFPRNIILLKSVSPANSFISPRGTRINVGHAHDEIVRSFKFTPLLFLRVALLDLILGGVD